MPIFHTIPENKYEDTPLGVIIRQSIKNTIISYVGVALGFISTILLYPVVLETPQIGLTQLLISVSMVSTQFAHLGMKNTIIRYFPYFRDIRVDKYGLLFLTIVVPLAGFLIFSILFFLFDDQLIRFFSDRSNLFEQYYLYLLPLVGVVLYFEVLNSYVRALQDSVTGSFLNEVLLRFFIVVLLILYWFGLFDFRWFMVFFVVAYGTQPVALLFYLFMKGELSFNIPFLNGKNRKLAKDMVSYGSFTMLGGLTTMLVGKIDIIMLGAMAGLADTGIYAIAFYVGSVIEIPKRSISKIATPILSDLIRNRKMEQVNDLYTRTSLNQIIAGSLFLVGIWANMHNLMGILPEEFRAGEWVIVVVGFAKLIDMGTGMNGQIIVHSKHYRFDLYTMIFLVILTVTTNYLLIPIYGILGAALATAISILVYNLIKCFFVLIKFSMQPFGWNALGVLAIAALCLLGSFQIPYMINFFVDVTVRSVAIASVFLGLILMFNISADVKALTNESIRRIQKYLNR